MSSKGADTRKPQVVRLVDFQAPERSLAASLVSSSSTPVSSQRSEVTTVRYLSKLPSSSHPRSWR